MATDFTTRTLHTLAAQDLSLLVCPDSRHIRLYRGGALVGFMLLHGVAPTSPYRYVGSAVTLGGREGLGHVLYGAGLVVAHQQQCKLHADPDTVIGFSTALWKKLWADAALPRQPLPIPNQSTEHHDMRFEELVWTNPTLDTEHPDWLDWPLHTLDEHLAAGTLLPHLYNVAFSASPTLVAAVTPHLSVMPLAAEEQSAMERLWVRRFASET